MSSKQRRPKTTRPAERAKDAAKRVLPKASSGVAEAVSPFAASDDEIESWLTTGKNRSQLEDYFGPEQLRELEALASESARGRARGGAKVLLLPGIMGSKLGRRRKLGPNDVIWIDPIDAATGRLDQLALPDDGKIEALGVMLFAYLKLKLRLKLAGFDAEFVPFDWRQSLRTLGRSLAARLAKSPPRTQLVAHSMGGLVARAALKDPSASKNVSSLIMLGTPNFGSFSPLQALRAEHSTASKLAAIDLENSPAELASDVFATFPGLIEMLPSPARWTGMNLYDRAAWPTDKPAPSQASLTSAKNVQSEALAIADERFFLIAGVNQETVVDFVVKDGKGLYETSREGDGTVPLAFCELPNAKTYYVEESHGSLPNNGAVEGAVVDLLREGKTDRLETTWLRAGVRSLRKRAPAPALEAFEGRRGRTLTSTDRRRVIEDFVSASSRSNLLAPEQGRAEGEAPASTGYAHSIRNVEVTRRRAHSIEICLARGSITEARSRALALGMFRGVDPAGAAGAIDERLGGAMKEAATRRMFSAEVGTVFVVPVGRHLLYADSVVFAGMGAFDAFNPASQQFVAENTIRTLLRSNIEDFATVLFGAGSGWSVPTALANQLSGYIHGILDSDHDHRMRRITICESDETRYGEIKEELYRLASTSLFDGVVVTFDEVVLPDAPISTATRAVAVLSERPDLAYLIVNREENPNPRGAGDLAVYRASVLTKGHKATVVSGSRTVSAGALHKHLAQLESVSATSLAKFGADLAEMVLEPTVANILKEMRGNHIVVVHDAVSSRIPWETLSIGGWQPAAEMGLSRRYVAENLSAAKWLEQRRSSEGISILLIANPTGDLAGADAEAERVRKFFTPNSGVRVNDRLRGAAATRDAVLGELASGKYDVVHYAGHAYFDAEQRSRSGILCAGNEVLSGAQLAELRSLPSLAFFNACESARVRSAVNRRDHTVDMHRRVERNVGLAEAFLRGGIANYIGTYWPVGDGAAESFATTFYGKLVAGGSIGDAIQAARRKVRDSGSIDWADYVHYGTQDFVLKTAP